MSEAVFRARELLDAHNQPFWDCFNSGWNNATSVAAFQNYARILFAHYADRVPIWISEFPPKQDGKVFPGKTNISLTRSHQRAKRYRRQLGRCQKHLDGSRVCFQDVQTRFQG